MDVSKTFTQFLSNLAIKNREDISRRYKTITKILNRKYWCSDSEVSNSLQVGSYGRGTAINGVSDLDMLFELPSSIFTRFDNHEGNGQSSLLQEIREAIKKTYPKTTIKGDGQVVVVEFDGFVIELLPAFPQNDNSYKYPDSSNGGSWRITKPRQERGEISRVDGESSGNLKKLCKMIRAWKNKNGVPMGGLLIDTLCYNFIQKNTEHKRTNPANFHLLVRDIFRYLSEQDKQQAYWLAPGSNQCVYSKGNFVTKAKKAYKKALVAIKENERNIAYDHWKEIFGRPFPSAANMGVQKSTQASAERFRDTEEYISDIHPVDIRYTLEVECRVKQDGFQQRLLREMICLNLPLKTNKNLEFYVKNTSAPEPYEIKWKVRNVGDEATRRDCIRGRIHIDGGRATRQETANFRGPHFVECYLIKNNVCVARDRIDVPISDY